jgi:uncharacterized protein YceK
VVDFSDVLCLIDSVEIDHVSGNTECFVISAAELEGGAYSLTVIGINSDGSAQSEELPFTVIAASSGQDDGSADPTVIEVDNVEDLAATLGALPENTAATPYPVKLRGITIGSSIPSGNTLRTMYNALNNRYVTLDLRDCTGTYFTNCSISSAPEKAYVVAVRLGQNVTTISDHSFSGCASLVKAELPGVTAIGVKAFVTCAALEEITLGSTPPILDASALPEGPVFATILVPNGAAQAYQSSTGEGWTAALKALVQEISNE